MERGIIKSTKLEKNTILDTDVYAAKTRLSADNDLQTIEPMHQPGVQHRAPKESHGFFSMLGSEAKKFFVSIWDRVPIQTLEEGERIAYASKDGAIVDQIYYKNDGTIFIKTDKNLEAEVDGDLIATVLGETILNSTGDVTATTPNFNIIGRLHVTGPIETDDEIIADLEITAGFASVPIEVTQHPHDTGNLGFVTGLPAATGGGVPAPATPPTMSGDNINMNNNDIINLGSQGYTTSSHVHDKTTNPNPDLTDVPLP